MKERELHGGIHNPWQNCHLHRSGGRQTLRDTSRQSGDTSSKVSAAVGKIGATAGKLAKEIGVAELAVGPAWVAAIERSREYRTEMGKLDTAYEQYQVLYGWLQALW